MKSIKSGLTSALFCLFLFFFILTFSISLPIYIRPFYYAHIDALNLTEASGYTQSEIQDAYDEVLDYLTRSDNEFSTGVMKHSNTGAEHFFDCKKLFSLNSAVLVASGFLIAVMLILQKTNSVAPFHIGGRGAGFWTGTFTLVLFTILAGLILINPDYAFVVFHKIFFPGKTNWVFDPRTDEIITVLPQQFFMNCAILIGAAIVLFSIALILFDIKYNKERHK